MCYTPLQTLMNVLVQTTVVREHHVQTLMAVLLVPVTLDTLEMESIAMVSAQYTLTTIMHHHIN